MPFDARRGYEVLRKYDEEHIDEDMSELENRRYTNVLFFNCTFKDMRGAVLENCVLTKSKIMPDSIEQLLGCTITLDCAAFADVEFNELAFDLFLMLLVRSKGNTEKRKKLIEIIGEERVRRILAADYPGNVR